MKVVYEDPVVERIRRAVHDADVANRRIGYIEVTVREANELSQSLQALLWAEPRSAEFRYYSPADAGETVGHVYGAEIRIEQSPS